MNRKATINVNGRMRPLAAGVLAGLLRELGYDPEQQGMAVAINGEVVRREEWSTRRVEADDRVEVVGAVQGG